MFIRQLDYLSPYVTFYHKGHLSHNSIFSGILSIISITFVVILAIYYALEIINRTDPNTFYFNSFIEDAGTFSLNRSTLFHFIRNIKKIQGFDTNEGFDFSIYNIIGVNTYYKSLINMPNMPFEPFFLFDHWLYGNCNKEMNTEGLDDILTDDLLEKSACITKYYSLSDKRYYSIGDPQFVWPNISHGTFNEKNSLYNIIVRKCDNQFVSNILGEGKYCKNIDEDYFKTGDTKLFHFYFLNNYINILDYDKPNSHFFYRLENPFSGEEYTVNDINISPALVKTHNGLIFDHIKEETSYIFDRNDAYVEKNIQKKTYMVYCFFLKNMQIYYERAYKRIQDVISSIGGINQAITIIAIYLNSFYNSYIVLSDTEILLHSSIHFEKQNNKKNTLNSIYLNKKLKTPKIKDNLYDNNKSSEKRIESEHKHSRNKNKTENDISINNMNKTNKKFNTTIKDPDGGNKTNINNIENMNSNNKNKDKVKEKESEQNGREKTFCNYLLYKITCGKKKQFFNTYQKFRVKIISEEHLVRNHLNIYNLLKITERKRHNRRNSYQLKDLINLV